MIAVDGVVRESFDSCQGDPVEHNLDLRYTVCLFLIFLYPQKIEFGGFLRVFLFVCFTLFYFCFGGVCVFVCFGGGAFLRLFFFRFYCFKLCVCLLRIHFFRSIAIRFYIVLGKSVFLSFGVWSFNFDFD